MVSNHIELYPDTVTVVMVEWYSGLDLKDGSQVKFSKSINA